jgi:hypothetical protein
MADDQTTQELTRSIQALQQAMLQGKTVDPKEIDRLDKALKNASRGSKSQSDAQKTQTSGTKEGTKVSVRFAGALAGTTKNVGNFAIAAMDAAGTIRESREQFSSLNGSIDLAAGMFKTTAKLTAGLGDAAGTAMSAIPLIGPVIGGFVSGVSKAAAALAEATADVAATIAKQITSEMDNANTAFRMMAQSGAVGADGLTGLANQAIQAGISFKDFASVTKESAHGLAFAFGDTATGAKKFADASEAMTPFRRELTALGVGAKQQNEMTANYIKLQARQGNIEGRSSRDLAQGSAEYVKRLTALSRLTGKSVDEQQKELDSQMSNARMVGALAEVQGKHGEKAASNMKDTAAFISGIDENIGKGLQDALSGNDGTDAAQQFKIAAGAMGAEAVNQLRNGEISAAEASAMIQKGLKKTADNFGGPGGLGKLAGLGTPIENSILGLQKFSARADLSANDFQKVIDKNKDLATTTDAATNNLVDSSVKMQKFATELDKISLKLMGSAGLVGAVGSVTDAMLASATEMNKMIAMGPEKYLQSKMGIKDVDMNVVDAQDAKNQEKQTGGQKFLSSISSLGEGFTGLFSKSMAAQRKADRIAKETGILKARGGVDIGDKYQKQFGTQVDTSASNTKKSDEMRALIRSNQYGGSLGSGQVGIAGPTNKLKGDSFSSSVSSVVATRASTSSQSGGTTSTTTSNSIQEEQVVVLKEIANQMARSNSTNEEILQATRQ